MYKILSLADCFLVFPNLKNWKTRKS